MTVLDDLADVRAGDKGSALILAVIARDARAHAQLVAHLTETRVAEHFRCPPHWVRRHEQTGIPALVFRIDTMLAGGVTGNLTLDGHGKTLGYHLATLPLPSGVHPPG